MFVKKNHFIMTIFLVLSFISIIGVKFGNVLTGLKDTFSKYVMIEESSSDIEVIKEEKETDRYRIQTFEGKIALFKNDVYQYSLDVYTFTLPKEDQKILNNGIIVTDIQEVYDILGRY